MKARTFARLTARLTFSDGTVAECWRVSWRSSNVASVAVASDGTLQAQDVPGEAEITATCGDFTGTVRVVVGRTVSIELWVHEPEPVLPGGFGYAFWLPGLSAVAEVLDGPDRGLTFLPSAAANPSLVVPVRVRLSADGYVSSEFEIAPEPGQSGTRLSTHLSLAPIPAAPGTIERLGILARGSTVRHDFHVDRSGLLAVSTWWTQEYSSRLELELRCHGEPVTTARQVYQSFGQGFEVNVPAGPCTLSITPQGGNFQQPYRVRMTVR